MEQLEELTPSADMIAAGSVPSSNAKRTTLSGNNSVDEPSLHSASSVSSPNGVSNQTFLSSDMKLTTSYSNGADCTSVLSGDTIAAVSTPNGVGGIAVIRVSGPESLRIVDGAWKGKALSEADSHTTHLGKYVATDGSLLDECVATIFRAPHTFTGEDVVELSVHGSKWIQREVLNDLIRRGARIAEPGEFTRRAFLNGRLDLAQAEGIADLIAASSKAAHTLAISQTRGNFSHALEGLREKLIEFASLLELELDFSEEDVEFADREKMLELSQTILRTIERLSASYSAGSVLKEGVPVVIAGVPNAGKSSLLNLLLNDDKAIVSDIPGTTRDTIEDTIEIDGILYRFIDTAGLRKSDDVVENIGIERARDRMKKARIVIWLLNPTTPLLPQQEELNRFLSENSSAYLILLTNKSDLLTDQSNLLTDTTHPTSTGTHAAISSPCAATSPAQATPSSAQATPSGVPAASSSIPAASSGVQATPNSPSPSGAVVSSGSHNLSDTLISPSLCTSTDTQDSTLSISSDPLPSNPSDLWLSSVTDIGIAMGSPTTLQQPTKSHHQTECGATSISHSDSALVDCSNTSVYSKEDSSIDNHLTVGRPRGSILENDASIDGHLTGGRSRGSILESDTSTDGHLAGGTNRDSLLEGDTSISEHLTDGTKNAATAKLHTIRFSTKTGEGIDRLKQRLNEITKNNYNTETDIIVTNARHYDALLKGADALKRAIEGIEGGISGDFIAQDVREALHHLGTITGAITTPTLLQSIFTRFCVGK